MRAKLCNSDITVRGSFHWPRKDNIRLTELAKHYIMVGSKNAVVRDVLATGMIDNDIQRRMLRDRPSATYLDPCCKYVWKWGCTIDRVSRLTVSQRVNAIQKQTRLPGAIESR